MEAFVKFYMEREGIKYDSNQTEARVLAVRSIWIHEPGIVFVALYLRNLQF